MARPRTVPDADVLDAALRIVERHGPARLTFAALAADAGLSPATLVQRFGTKRDLLLATARHATGRWTTPLAELPDGASLEDVAAALAAPAGVARAPGDLAGGVAFLELDLRDRDFGALARTGAASVREHLTRLLATSSELRPDTDAPALAMLLETVYHGTIIRWALHGEPGDPASAVRAQALTALAPYRG